MSLAEQINMFEETGEGGSNCAAVFWWHVMCSFLLEKNEYHKYYELFTLALLTSN